MQFYNYCFHANRKPPLSIHEFRIHVSPCLSLLERSDASHRLRRLNRGPQRCPWELSNTATRVRTQSDWHRPHSRAVAEDRWRHGGESLKPPHMEKDYWLDKSATIIFYLARWKSVFYIACYLIENLSQCKTGLFYFWHSILLHTNPRFFSFNSCKQLHSVSAPTFHNCTKDI